MKTFFLILSIIFTLSLSAQEYTAETGTIEVSFSDSTVTIHLNVGSAARFNIKSIITSGESTKIICSENVILKMKSNYVIVKYSIDSKRKRIKACKKTL